MFVRKVSVRLRADSLKEFTSLMECEILPWLQKQEGFLALITLAAPDGSEVAALSFWESQRDAQAYHSSGYPEALKILGKLLEGGPYVKTFEVVGSTCPIGLLQESHVGRSRGQTMGIVSLGEAMDITPS
jgi:heme-degrading monooxygenase HmoA